MPTSSSHAKKKRSRLHLKSSPRRGTRRSAASITSSTPIDGPLVVWPRALGVERGYNDVDVRPRRAVARMARVVGRPRRLRLTFAEVRGLRDELHAKWREAARTGSMDDVVLFLIEGNGRLLRDPVVAPQPVTLMELLADVWDVGPKGGTRMPRDILRPDHFRVLLEAREGTGNPAFLLTPDDSETLWSMVSDMKEGHTRDAIMDLIDRAMEPSGEGGIPGVPRFATGRIILK